MKKILTLILLIGIIAGCSNSPESVEDLRKAGEKAFAKKDFPKAVELFHRALTEKQSDQQLLYYLGVCFQRLQRHDSALVYLKRADLLYPDDRETNLAIYYSARETNNYQYGIDAISTLIKTGDPEREFYGELGDLYLAIDNYIRAYIYYDKLLKIDSTNPELYLRLSNVAAMIDSTHLSLKIVDEAIKRFGEVEPLMMNRAIYLSALKRYDEAEKILRSYLGKSTNPYGLNLNLANVLSKTGKKDKMREALKIYEQLASEYGSSPYIDSTILDLRRKTE